MPASIVPTLNIPHLWKQGLGFAEKYLLPSLSSLNVKNMKDREYYHLYKCYSSTICTSLACCYWNIEILLSRSLVKREGAPGHWLWWGEKMVNLCVS